MQQGDRNARDLLNCSVPAVSNLEIISTATLISAWWPAHFQYTLTPLDHVSVQFMRAIYGIASTHINFNLLSVRVLDCGIIALYPHILYKLR